MKQKILIVDDLPENLLALERVLAGIEVEFVRAGTGNEALAKTLEDDFALALIDVQMPDMDGFETVALMRQRDKTRYLPVIFVSAIYNEKAHLIRGIESGAVDFIVKPIVPEIMIGKVKIFLELNRQKIEVEKLANERKEREKIFRLLANNLVGGVNDQEMYNGIVKTCASIFRTEYAMVGRLIDDGKVETCACLIDGKIAAPVTYDLKGSPCEDAIINGTSIYPKGVRQLFPEDRDLEEMQVEGYIGIPLKDSQGKPLGILNAFSRQALKLPDYAHEVLEIIAGRAAAVLERQKTDHDKIQLQEMLQQAQKMEAIGTLAGGVAHDFNNILTIIIGNTELSIDAVMKGSMLYDNLKEILAAGRRASDLTKQILTFSRKSHEERKPIQIHPILKEAAKMLRSTIPSTIEIRQKIDERSGMVIADPTQIHQIIINLCTNAAHAMQEKGGILEISLSPVVLTNESKNRYVDLLPGPFIELKISDTGTGIDSKIINRIYEPFFTTKEKDKGTGMGLAVVYGIIKSYNGDISIETQKGKGSTFTILLPKVLTEPLDRKEPQSEIPTGNERILFVDDEKMIMIFGKRMLESLGYTVTIQNSSLEALGIFSEKPGEFDLVITDQTMPHMTGLELVQRLFEIDSNIPVILCTGYSEAISPKKVEDAGIKALVYKPFNRKEFAEIIRKVLDGTKNT